MGEKKLLLLVILIVSFLYCISVYVAADPWAGWFAVGFPGGLVAATLTCFLYDVALAFAAIVGGLLVLFLLLLLFFVPINGTSAFRIALTISVASTGAFVVCYRRID